MERTGTVMSVAANMLRDLDLESLLDGVLAGARELTGARYAALGVLGRADDGTPPGELARFITAGLDEAACARIGALPRGLGVLGELIRDPRPLRLDNVGSHPSSYGFPDRHPPMRSFLGVPLLVGGEPYGNLYLTEKGNGEPFSPADETAAIMLAQLAGIAIENARMYGVVKDRREELERTVAALEVTTQISRAVGGQIDLPAILDLVAKRGRAVVDARVLLIELRDEEELVVASGAGELPEELIGRRVALTGTVAEQALRTQSTQRLSDELNRARFQEHGLGGLGVQARDGLVVPLIFREVTYGVLLAVDRLNDGPEFGAEDARLLEAFAASAATAVATARTVACKVQRLAAVVESSSDAIITTDREGLVTSWNNGAELLYGYSAEEMIGGEGRELVPEDRGREHAILEQVLAGGVLKRYESVRVRKDSSPVEVSLSVSAIRDPDGRVVGAASIGRDLTDQKQIEHVLAQTRRLESLGQLAGGVAHDMNNLLGVILNSADFALDTLDEGPGSEDVHELHAAALRATALVRQLLQFARLDATTIEELDVGAVVTDLESMLARTLGEQIALGIELADERWPLEADRSQLEQVVLNLTVNARDAMPEGGRLTIGVANVVLDEAAMRSQPLPMEPGDYVCVSVRDTGTGMGPEVISRAFEPFYTTKPPGSGTGLGLATVYGILTKAGGHIRVDSEPAKGTLIEAFWPVGGRAGGEAALRVVQADHSVSLPVPGATVLLVEDEGALRAIAVRLLSSAGYTVLAAALPHQAIELGEGKDRIDLLLTDLVMPEMSGSKLAARIRSLRPGLPVVYMSGYVAGADDLPETAHFIAKPFGRDELLSIVGAAIPGPGAAEAQSA